MSSSDRFGPSVQTGSLRQEIAELAPWFHNLHLPGGEQTAPEHFLGDFPAYKWSEIATCLPEDLTGWSVLDIGCNAGFYSLELASRGARVTGIDSNPHYLKQARWAADQFGLRKRIAFHRKQVYDLVREAEIFDLVLFLGAFYHLRYPLLGLDIAARKVGRMMLFQTMTMPGREILADPGTPSDTDREPLRQPGWPKMAFIEKRLAGDPTNGWVPNHAGVEAMLRSSGMKVVGHPGEEVFLCEPDPANVCCSGTWNAAEFAAATGYHDPRLS